MRAALSGLQNLQLFICSVTAAVADRTSCCFVVIGIMSPRSVSLQEPKDLLHAGQARPLARAALPHAALSD